MSSSCHTMDCSQPGSSVCGISQVRTLEQVAMPSSRRILLTQGLNPGLPHCRQTLYHLSHQGSQDQSQGLVSSIPGGLSAALPGLLHTRSLISSRRGLCRDILQSSFPIGEGWQLSGNITTCSECSLALTGVRMK